MKKVIIFLILIIGAAAGGWYGYSRMKEPESLETVAVKRGNIFQRVEVTGKTKPAKSVDLAFQVSGKVVRVLAEAGEKVYAGQTVAELDRLELEANLAQSKANKESEEARLADLKSGTKQEDISVSEAQVSAAQTAVRDAMSNLVNRLKDSYTKADDAIRNKTDQLFSNPKTVNPQLNIAVSDSQVEMNLEEDRVLIEKTLKTWMELNAEITEESAKKDVQSVRANLDSVKVFLDSVAGLVNGLTPTASLSQTNIDTYKKDISAGRDNVNDVIAAVIAAEEKLNTAESNLLLAKKELELKKTGNTKEVIRTQEAKVKQYDAQIAATEAQLQKTILRTPISGILTKQDLKVGEIASANSPLVSIIGDSGLEVEAYIPELNIGKIKLGNAVAIKFDAFPGETFSGRIVYMDPAETVIEGISNFKIKISFDDKYEQLKSGLTADLEILVGSKENVLTVPIYALALREGKYFAKKAIKAQDKVTFEERSVALGMRGDDGLVEILSGLEEGDSLLLDGLKEK